MADVANDSVITFCHVQDTYTKYLTLHYRQACRLAMTATARSVGIFWSDTSHRLLRNMIRVPKSDHLGCVLVAPTRTASRLPAHVITKLKEAFFSQLLLVRRRSGQKKCALATDHCRHQSSRQRRSSIYTAQACDHSCGRNIESSKAAAIPNSFVLACHCCPQTEFNSGACKESRIDLGSDDSGDAPHS
eukprot:2538152-Pleurochrysis_carterae.AAC.10